MTRFKDAIDFTWALLKAKPTTLVGFGITDAASDAELAAEASDRASADSTHAALTTAAHGGIVANSDSRLSDNRVPSAHASTHANAGSDPITISEGQVTNLATDLAAKAPLASPALTGAPTAPTAAGGTSTTQIATTAFVQGAVTGGSVADGDKGDVTVSSSGTVWTVDNLPESRITNLVSDLAAKAPLASPTFTGTPAAPTAAGGMNTTQVATTAFTTDAVATHEADTTSVHGIADTSALYRSGGTDVAVADGGTGASTASAARGNLGLGTAAIVDTGTGAANVPTITQADARYQPLDPDLTTIAGLTATTDNFMVAVASAWASRTPAQARTSLALAGFPTLIVASSTYSATAYADYRCDGTNDEVQIQQAIDALPAAGGTVQLTAGTYNVARVADATGDTLTTPYCVRISASHGPVQLIGAGIAATIINLTDSQVKNSISILIRASSAAKRTAPTRIADMHVTCANPAGQTAWDDFGMIEVAYADNVTLERVKISSSPYIGAQIFRNSQQCKVIDCDITYSSYGNGLRVEVPGAQILNNVFNGDASVNKACLDLSCNADITVQGERMVVSGNAFNSGRTGIGAGGQLGAILTENTFTGITNSSGAAIALNPYTAVAANYSAINNIIANNSFKDCKQCITLGAGATYGVQYTMIFGNQLIETVSGGMVNGIVESSGAATHHNYAFRNVINGATTPTTMVGTGSSAFDNFVDGTNTGHTQTASTISDASANGRSLITAADYAAMRALLALVPGTNVQAWDADLDAIAALTTTSFGRSYLALADAAAARNLAASAPLSATYITQTANSELSAEQALSSLATGYLKNTTGTGVLSVQSTPIPQADLGTGSGGAGLKALFDDQTYKTISGGGTVTSVGVTAPAAGITSSGGPITTSGNITLALADDLSALEGLSGTGLANRTASNTWSNVAVDASLVLSSTTLAQTTRSRRVAIANEDFVYMIAGIATRVGGTGAGVAVDSTSNVADSAGRTGWAVHTTGTTTTGRAMLGHSANETATIVLGVGAFTFEAVVKVTVLSDGTETFTCRVGLNDAAGSDGADAVMFRYTHSVNSGKWECVTRSNGSETATDSGITVVADTAVKLGFVVNAAGTSVAFSVNGSVVQTHTTNIPTTTTRATAVAIEIAKSAGSTARTMLTDYVECYLDLTTPR